MPSQVAALQEKIRLKQQAKKRKRKEKEKGIGRAASATASVDAVSAVGESGGGKRQRAEGEGPGESTGGLAEQQAADKQAANSSECMICMCEMSDSSSKQRTLRCLHVFHKVCIDKWIEVGDGSCPICKCQVKPPIQVVSVSH